MTLERGMCAERTRRRTKVWCMWRAWRTMLLSGKENSSDNSDPWMLNNWKERPRLLILGNMVQIKVKMWWSGYGRDILPGFCPLFGL